MPGDRVGTTPSWIQTSCLPYEELSVSLQWGELVVGLMPCPLEWTQNRLHLEKGFVGGLWKGCVWGLRVVFASTVSKIPVGSLLATVWVDTKSWPVVFLFPTGHWAAAASWLQTWTCWFWVLVHISQRAAPEQSLCLLASGKEGHLYCRQTQVPFCISLNKMLQGREAERTAVPDLCALLGFFLLCSFPTSYLMRYIHTSQEWEAQAMHHNFTLQLAKSVQLLISSPRRTTFPFLQTVSEQIPDVKETKPFLLLCDIAVSPTELCWKLQGSNCRQKSASLLVCSLVPQSLQLVF